jgi:hypothetical protein
LITLFVVLAVYLLCGVLSYGWYVGLWNNLPSEVEVGIRRAILLSCLYQGIFSLPLVVKARLYFCKWNLFYVAPIMRRDA